MTYSDIKSRLAELEADLRILRNRQLAYMTAFKAFCDMHDMVAKQEDSERKRWWLDRLKSLEGLFHNFDRDGGEIYRLQIAYEDQSMRMDSIVERAKELREENDKLRELL